MLHVPAEVSYLIDQITQQQPNSCRQPLGMPPPDLSRVSRAICVFSPCLCPFVRALSAYQTLILF